MVLKTTVQKETSKLSLHKASLEAAVRICFSKQVFLKVSQQETPLLEPLFNKVAGLKVYYFTKKRQHRCFPVDIAKFLRTAFFRKPPVATFVGLIK